MSGQRGRKTLSKDIHFAQIPEWVLFHEDLTHLDVRLYGILCRYSEGHGWPGRRELAGKLGVSSLRTVDAALDRLVDAEAVTVTHRYTDAGDRTSNLYDVHVAPPQEVAQQIAPPPATECTTGDAADCATGGAADCSVQIATSTDTPLTPSADATDPPLLAVVGDCPTHTDRPGANCRACGTSPKRLRERQAADAAAERRAAEAEESRHRRAIAAANAAVSRSPTVAALIDETRQTLARNRRSTP